MAGVRNHVEQLWTRIRTVPKLLTVVFALGFVVCGKIALDAFVDVAKDKAETYATNWAASIVSNPTAKQLLAKLAGLAVRYPTTTVVAGFLLLLLVIVSISAIQIRVEHQTPESVPANAPTVSPSSHEFKEIVNQRFQGQEILLDGYVYIGCAFDDVTFVYNNGDTGGFDPTCKVRGNIGFKSRDPHIKQMLFFLEHLHFMNPAAAGRYTPILQDLPNPESALSPKEYAGIGLTQVVEFFDSTP
jgi:hypothetical protein